MDTYEKKYKEALELARVAAFNGHQILMEGIFPELKEPEDEKIREYLIRYIDNTMKSSELKSKLLAWLEKQGEQKPQRIISAEAKEAMYDKPACAWSEEDKEMCQETIDWFEKKCFPYALENDNLARESIKWLKSLKGRYTWNPTEEQLKALHDINLTGNISYEGQGQELINLYNDLKKLKGE